MEWAVVVDRFFNSWSPVILMGIWAVVRIVQSANVRDAALGFRGK